MWPFPTSSILSPAALPLSPWVPLSGLHRVLSLPLAWLVLSYALTLITYSIFPESPSWTLGPYVGCFLKSQVKIHITI